jgi:ATP-dependent Lhr-like helicase
MANTTFLCEETEAVLQAVALIELAREGWVERVNKQERCWPVLVHQVLALTLQFGAISAQRCWEQLSRVPDFRSISREAFDLTVEHMTKQEFLFEAGGLLSMGEKAERAYGRKNFQELYAVFSSPILYRVVTNAGRDLGSLEQDFVDRLVVQMSSFLLGGRAWSVDRVSHEDRTVIVQEAPRGIKPSWGGFTPQLLGSSFAAHETNPTITTMRSTNPCRSQQARRLPLLSSALPSHVRCSMTRPLGAGA